jgi:alcohol dehydrogenase
MKAMVLREHGGLANIRLETDFPDPQAGPGDVVLRVRATSLNYHDIFTRRGMPGIKVPMPAIMGLDVAGELVAVGPGVDDWAAGDRVLVDPINRVEGGGIAAGINGGDAPRYRARRRDWRRSTSPSGSPANPSIEGISGPPPAISTPAAAAPARRSRECIALEKLNDVSVADRGIPWGFRYSLTRPADRL